MNKELTQNIASEIPFFQTIEEKESFLFLIGASITRVISLQKAAEIMKTEPEMFLKLLDIMNIDFSYLSEEDIITEKNW